jgi:hypothetical protein
MKLSGHRELLPRARKTAARRLQQREIWKERAGNRHHTRHGSGSCCCCCCHGQTKNFATQNPEKQKTQKHTHTHTHTHTHRSLRIFFFFFFFFFNKIPNKLFVRRFTRCLRQCKREEATAKTRS